MRTRSPISGEMSLPNCCSVVRKRLSLLSCRAPQAGGSCWLASDEELDDEGPLLKPLGGEGAPFKAVGEWLVPFVTAGGTKSDRGKSTHGKGPGQPQPPSLPCKPGESGRLKTVAYNVVFVAGAQPGDWTVRRLTKRSPRKSSARPTPLGVMMVSLTIFPML